MEFRGVPPGELRFQLAYRVKLFLLN